MSEDFVVVHDKPLRDFGSAVLQAAGVPPSTADLVAESLVAANLRGVDSHGIQLLLWYTQQILDGNVDLHARGRVVSQSGSTMVYDGQNGIGQLIADICTGHAIRLTQSSGIAIVTARDTTHFGACAWWAQKIASAGMLGIVHCNATPLVAPWQGREKLLGTNPICMAVPGPPTFLLDMATTTVALNRIHKAVLSGDKAIPEGWAMDLEGNPTTDPQTALDGLPMPLGGYKGTGLALMVEILCSVLSGGAMLTEVGGLRVKNRPMRVSHAFLAIDVARFMPIEEFCRRMQFIRDTVKNSQPAAGFSEVLIAGDPEWRSEEERRRSGIPIARGVWSELSNLARQLNVTAMPPLE